MAALPEAVLGTGRGRGWGAEKSGLQSQGSTLVSS